jgi:hypothetical protein
MKENNLLTSTATNDNLAMYVVDSLTHVCVLGGGDGDDGGGEPTFGVPLQ